MGVNLHHFQCLFFISSNCCSVYINAVYILGVIIELLFSIFSENISGKTISMSVLGVCGLFVGVRRASGILTNSVFGILCKFGLFPSMSVRNSVNLSAFIVLLFLITLILVVNCR